MDWDRRIIESSAGGLWVVDLDGRTLDANAAAASLLGTEREALLGKGLGDYLDATGRAQLVEHLDAVASGRVNATEVDCLFHRPDGTAVWAVVREALLTDEAGAPVAILLNVDDISTRKQLLLDLQESERRRADAEEVARLGSWVWDVRSGVITWSDGLRRLYGERTPVVFASYGAFLESVHPDDRLRVATAVDRVRCGEPSFEFEARVHADRGWLWVYSRGVGSWGTDGELEVVIGTHLDVTQVRDTDDALRDLVKQNDLLKAVASTANDASSLHEVLAQARSLVLLHDDWDRARAFFPAPDGAGLEPLVVDGHGNDEDDDPQHADVRRRELDTALRCLAERRAVWDEDARLTLAFPVFLDDELLAVLTITSLPPLYRHDMIESMTEEVAAELSRVALRERTALELGEARDRALQASKHKSDFLSTMSHEIRTPLNGVIGLTELLGRTVLDERQQHLLSGIDLSSRALLALINDVLDFSKIEAGRLELEMVDLEPRAVLDSVTGMLAEQARTKGLDLSVSCSPDVPPVMSGDPTRLAQVIANLGSNAVKFTTTGRVAIRAHAAVREGGSSWLRVEVADTGHGIPADLAESLFEAFAQGDVSTNRHHGGTGLGLAISKEIVDAMGGRIGVTSHVGQGSTFWFEVPLAAPTGAQLGAELTRVRDQLAGMRVLVVDDTSTNRKLVVEQLAWWGVASRAVNGAAAALAALEVEDFDAVLLDVRMPEVDGLSLARSIRHGHRQADVPLVVLTSSLPLDEAALAAHGISHCLTKPVGSATLREVLRAVRHPTAPELETVADRSPHRLLVVEDNAVNRLVAVGFLDALGHDADVATDGVEALDAMRRVAYDLVLMDLQMPGLDGFATTTEIRRREVEEGLARTPVVAMTAAAIDDERERAWAVGMDDFLTKPVTSAALGEVLERWLGTAPAVDAAGPARRATASPVPAAGPDVLDRDRLEDLLDLSPGGDYLARAVGRFSENASRLLGDVQAAGGGESLARAAHTLRGAALNLGAREVGRLAGLVEDAGRHGDAADADVLAALDRSLQTAVLALDDYCASIRGVGCGRPPRGAHAPLT